MNFKYFILNTGKYHQIFEESLYPEKESTRNNQTQTDKSNREKTDILEGKEESITRGIPN